MRIFIYFTLALAICSIFIAVPGYKEEITPLGSVLSAYFYNKHSYSSNVYTTFKMHLDNITDYHLKKFYAKFNWQEQGKKVALVSDVDATWQLYDQNGEPKPNYLQYWQTIRGDIKAFYNANIAPIHVKTPIVHFRCSDAPFVTHPAYHLTKASTVHWLINKIKDRGYSQVTILSCNRHRRVKNNQCAAYLQFYRDMFTAAGIQVSTQCHDIYTDFAMMVYSPLLISLNESSFAFMAGIAKDPNDYISCNLGREHNGKYLAHDQADWQMAKSTPLLHNEVVSYKNTTQVLKQLQDY